MVTGLDSRTRCSVLRAWLAPYLQSGLNSNAEPMPACTHTRKMVSHFQRTSCQNGALMCVMEYFTTGLHGRYGELMRKLILQLKKDLYNFNHNLPVILSLQARMCATLLCSEVSSQIGSTRRTTVLGALLLLHWMYHACWSDCFDCALHAPSNPSTLT